MHTKYTKVEIDLKRILKHCERIIIDSKDLLIEPYFIKSFEKFLEVAKAKLGELEQLKTLNDQNRVFDPAIPSKEVVQEYQRKINYLKEVRNTDKNLTNEAIQQTKVIRNKFLTYNEKLVELEARTKVRVVVVSEMKKLITPEEDQSETNSNSKKENHRDSSQKIPPNETPQKRPIGKNLTDKLFSDDIEERLMYTQNMERLTENIKEKQIETHNRIKNDDSNVNRIEQLTSSNTDQATQRNESLQLLVNSRSKSTLLYYSIIFFATLFFFGIFTFIKIFPK